MNVTIYHHPRCSKSRKTLELIRSRGVEPQIVEYLKTPPDAATIVALAGLLAVPVAELLRRGEAEFAAAGDLPLDDDEALASWLEQHPSVLQRPIVVAQSTNTAVIGRPPENVLALLPE